MTHGHSEGQIGREVLVKGKWSGKERVRFSFVNERWSVLNTRKMFTLARYCLYLGHGQIFIAYIMGRSIPPRHASLREFMQQ
jgi:hypothetical protein